MNRKALLLLAFLTISASAFADGDDPPSRVARLNFQSGSVSFRPGSVEEWTAATLNYPMTTGDHLWSDISVGIVSPIRFGGSSGESRNGRGVVPLKFFHRRLDREKTASEQEEIASRGGFGARSGVVLLDRFFV